jgi:hypothetical protein
MREHTDPLQKYKREDAQQTKKTAEEEAPRTMSVCTCAQHPAAHPGSDAGGLATAVCCACARRSTRL